MCHSLFIKYRLLDEKVYALELKYFIVNSPCCRLDLEFIPLEIKVPSNNQNFSKVFV